jgi:hypothetical protein
MTPDQAKLVERLHEALVEEIRSRRPEYLREPFTVAEIYQELVPYRSYRDRIGAAMNGDYEDALLRLLSGTGGYLVLESEPARKRLQEELQSSNPNTGIFREYAALDVRLNQARIPIEMTPRASSVAENPPPGAKPGPVGDDGVLSLSDIPVVSPPARLERQMQAPTADERPRQAEKSTRTGGGAESRGKPAGDLTTPCRWCREQLPKKEKLRFCPFCGMDVNLVPCRVCGEELEPEWRFCIACGSQVVTEE